MEPSPNLAPIEPEAAIDLAVLDAPVLARGALTVFLLYLADAGAFDPVWSDQIHAEWMRDQKAHPDEHARTRRQALERAFPAANVAASRDVMDEVMAHCSTPLTRKCAHVAAAALAARAAFLVTDDRFPLRPVMAKLWHDVAVLDADAFCLDLLARRPDRVLAGARAHQATQDPTVWAARLGQNLPGTAARLKALLVD